MHACVATWGGLNEHVFLYRGASLIHKYLNTVFYVLVNPPELKEREMDLPGSAHMVRSGYALIDRWRNISIVSLCGFLGHQWLNH